MNTRKTLSLPGRPNKVVLTKSDLSPPPSDGYRMDEWGAENRGYDSRPADNRPMGYPRAHRGRHDDRGNRHKQRQGGNEYRHPRGDQDSRGNSDDGHVNKIRRGPGRRLAKEKRMRSMDPALLQKYSALSSALQEKVNATIEIYYQQQMAKAYKGQVDEAEVEEDHFAEDVVYDAETGLES